MGVVAEPPSVAGPEADVIEEARRRQRRHRIGAIAATVLAVASATAVIGLVADSGHEDAPDTHSRATHPAASITTAACITVPASWTTGKPSPAFLALLGVLRRPPTPADSLPSQIRSSLGGGQVVYANYVRRAQVAGGRTLYVLPVRSRCASSNPEIALLACIQQANGHIINAGVGGGSTAPQIRAHGMFLIGGSCLHTSQATLIAGIVPDAVARITLRYPSITVTATAINNVVVAAVPHPGSALSQPIAMTWRSADGHIIKTFNRL
jgi:hypothetical protein